MANRRPRAYLRAPTPDRGMAPTRPGISPDPVSWVRARRVAFAFRFVSIDPLTFRPSDALLAYRPVGATYEPNHRYYNARSYGDVAGIANLREPREYRSVVFTTDALGYRNPAHALHAEIGAILAGASFA